MYYFNILLQLIPAPEEQGGTDDGGDDLTYPTVGSDSELLEEPTAEAAAHETQKEVDDATFALTIGEFCSNEACKDA